MSTSPSPTRMAQAAVDFLESLPADAGARFGFDDPARIDWAFFPREMADGAYLGMPLYAMTSDQRKLAMKLARTGLRSEAYHRVATIMSLDLVLDEREHYVRTHWRDPMRYWITIYGEPGPTGLWGWRYEGHHVSVNYTIRDGEVLSSTPLFMGASPAGIGPSAHPIIRPCGQEEDAGRALFSSLDTDQQAVALLDATAPIDTIVPNISFVPEVSEPGNPPAALTMFQEVHEAMTPQQKRNLRLVAAEPSGLGADAMSKEQVGYLHDLIAVYLDRLPEDLADRERTRLGANDWAGLHFAWAGSAERHQPHYYRIHNPDFLVEYDCVQDNATHIHAVWRNPRGDFGEDILRAHLARNH